MYIGESGRILMAPENKICYRVQYISLFVDFKKDKAYCIMKNIEIGRTITVFMRPSYQKQRHW